MANRNLYIACGKAAFDSCLMALDSVMSNGHAWINYIHNRM